MTKSIIFYTCLSTLLLFGCKGDEPEPAPINTPVELIANAGPDVNTTAGRKVILNGALSKGATGFSYAWTYLDTEIPEADLNFIDHTSSSPSFIPPKNGVYHFKLTTTFGTDTSEDNVVVTASGAITIGGFSPTTMYANVESDPAKPDYLVTSTLTFTESSKIQEGVVMEFAETAGLEITTGFVTITGATLRSSTTWKGIRVAQTGALEMEGCTIVNGGKGLFSGEKESAALINRGTLPKLKNSVFQGSTGYDVINGYAPSYQVITGNTFTSVKPLKSPIGSVTTIDDNHFPEQYDYITLSTYGSADFTSGNADFVFAAKKYLIEDDAMITIGMTFNAGATIFIPEGKGIYSHGFFKVKGTAEAPVRMEGLDGKLWKGLALKGEVTIDHLDVINAGAMPFDYKDVFDSPDLSAIHYYPMFSAGSITHTNVINSQGHGLLLSNSVYSQSTFTDNHFESKQPAVRVDYSRINFFLPEKNNTYEVPEGVATIELTAPGDYWLGDDKYLHPLGGNQFYLVTEDIIILRYDFTILPGVTIRFKADKGIRTPADEASVNYPGLRLFANGTEENPIIFDRETDTSGNWKGICLDRHFEMQHCRILNAGSVKFDNATEKGALIVLPFSSGADNYIFSDNTINNSGGYGVVLEADALDEGIATSNNSFNNNTLQNIKNN